MKRAIYEYEREKNRLIWTAVNILGYCGRNDNLEEVWQPLTCIWLISVQLQCVYNRPPVIHFVFNYSYIY